MYCYSVMRKVEMPYLLVSVELSNDVVPTTNIVDCGVDDVRISHTARLTLRGTLEGA